MPNKKPQDLYIAGSLHDLNAKCSYDFEKGRSIKSHLTLVNKAFNAAEEAYKKPDEERAYILYMRYLDATTKIRKMKDFQQQADHYNTLFGQTKSRTALERAESLSSSLKKRYKKLEDSKSTKKEEKPKSVNGPSKNELKNGVEQKKPEELFPEGTVTSQQLYQLLYKEARNLILMDVRSADDYDDSQIIHNSCINVPNTVIKPGTVTSRIEEGIRLCNVKTWNARDSADLVVLLDWHSTAKRLNNMTDPLRSLKDSIYKWDQDKVLKREPVVLEGGYADWLETFPQFTSNPQVKPPSNKPKTGNVNSLLDFSYADLKVDFHPPNTETNETYQVENESNAAPVHPNSPMFEDKEPLSEPNSFNEVNGFNLPQNNLSSTQPQDTTPSLYPKIDRNLSLPKVLQTVKPTQVEPVSIPTKQPTFDRSVKPKLPSTNANHDPIVEAKENKPPSSIQPATKTSPSHTFHGTVDRSTKPILKPVVHDTVVIPSTVVVKPPSTADKDKVNELQQQIIRMQQEEEEKKKKLVEIEEKQKLAQLQSIQRQMQRDAEELDKKREFAEKELAATMRHINKPDEPKNISNKNDKISNNSTSIEHSAQNEIPVTKPSENSKLYNVGIPSDKKSGNLTNSDVTVKSIANKGELSVGKALPTEPESSKKVLPAKPVSHDSSNNAPSAKPSAPQQAQAKAPGGNESVKNTASKPKTHNTASALAKPNQTHNDVKNEVPNIPPPVYATINKAKKLESTVPLDVPKKLPTKSTSQIVTNKSTYNAPLKDEPDTKSHGLKRSFSSPNIAKMVEEERNVHLNEIPNRSQKPPERALVPSREFKPKVPAKEDPVIAGLNHSLRGVYGGQGRAICGLRNLGNSCYMNSVLQCMFNTTQLAEYILTNYYKKDINRENILGHGGRVAESFAVLLRAIWSGQYRYLIPNDIKQITGSINPLFGGYSQEDSHEFLLLLLDGLHEDLNTITNFKYEEEPDNDHLSDVDAATEAWKYHKKRNMSIIVELFTGQFKATVTCLHCHKTSRKFDAFRFLSLSLPSKSASIYDIIRDFGKAEKMAGSDKWKCPRCNALREAARAIEIWKLPPVLIIHFKRFVHTGRWRDKIHTNINFPLSGLDLRKFTCGPVKRSTYDLFAVSHHQGAGLDSGHYTASCKSVVDNSWYKYDDTEVYGPSPPQGSTAFILFYCCYPRQIPNYSKN